jgi:hypothetical protein
MKSVFYLFLFFIGCLFIYAAGMLLQKGDSYESTVLFIIGMIISFLSPYYFNDEF